jgi:hypothetical protein
VALSAALPELPPASLADWPLGRRNQALVELHCRCFGEVLHGWSACVSCHEKMELEVYGSALLRQKYGGVWQIAFCGKSFRLPSSRDLAAIAAETDSHAAVLCLLERCRESDAECPNWTEDDVERIGEQMALADPLAEIRVELRCPVCGHESVETLDIVSFIWEEIEARAKRLLWEVHSIASVYGWNEAEVLSLSAQRRNHYLNMVLA